MEKDFAFKFLLVALADRFGTFRVGAGCSLLSDKLRFFCLPPAITSPSVFETGSSLLVLSLPKPMRRRPCSTMLHVHWLGSAGLWLEGHGDMVKLKIKWLQGNKTGCLNQPRQRGHLSEMKHFGLVVHTTENENKSSLLPLSRLMRWWIHLCKSYEEFWTLSGPVHKPATTNLPRLETANTYHTKPCNKTGGNRNFKSGMFGLIVNWFFLLSVFRVQLRKKTSECYAGPMIFDTPKHDIPISPLLSLPSTSENPIFRLRGSLRRHPNNRPPHSPLTSEPPPFPPPHSSSQQSQPCRYSQNLQQQATKFGDRLDMADDQHEEFYIGALVRNEIPITCDDWRNKELNESKEKIWSEIKRCFNIEEERRGFCMKLAGKLLRGFRTFLSSKFLKDADGNFVDAELPKKYESLISAEEWEAFKSKRQDPVFQRIIATNRERASSPAYPYRKGRVGYGRLEQSMLQKEESSETSLPAHVLWKEVRVGKSGVPQEEVLHVYQKCEELSQSLSPDDTKGILSRALDVPEYSGRVRGKGFGVTPTSLSIKKGKAPSNRELHARLEAMQAELDALRREREVSASTVYRDASDKNSINCTFQPNIPEGISHCQLYLSSPYYRMVGKGKVHNVSGVLLHTRELPAGCLKVSVDIAVEPNAALPYPSDDSDATTVHEAVGSFVAWPTNLICVGYEWLTLLSSLGENELAKRALMLHRKLFSVMAAKREGCLAE
ncbi:hypothetical protein KIW84_076644 [Lathyrus oleraceus]|uniref:DUF8039 domain-containing protein n=1 Tax=Pisum sativum TaxID=3888 RepID=A0A9D4VXD2_PEA|nr:hypothetical protein KIW84_076644 [Pisum sativum]